MRVMPRGYEGHGGIRNVPSPSGHFLPNTPVHVGHHVFERIVVTGLGVVWVMPDK